MKRTMFFVALAMLMACKKDDPKETAPATPPPAANSCPGAMTLSIDGVSQSVSSYNNSLIFFEDGDLSSRRMDIRASIGSRMVILTISNMDWQNPPTDGVVVKTYNADMMSGDCRAYQGTTYCDGMLGTYMVNDTTVYMTAEGNIPGYITVTSIDGANTKVSGNFNFSVIDMFNGTDTMVVSGTFTNQCYTLME